MRIGLFSFLDIVINHTIFHLANPLKCISVSFLLFDWVHIKERTIANQKKLIIMKKFISVRKLRKRISFLESIDLAATNKEMVCNLIKHSFKIPFNEFPWETEKRKPIYRSCTHDNKKPQESRPYCLISRISYNPDPSDEFGRAYLGNGKVVSFASDGFDVAIIESCQDSLRTTEDREFYVTVGEWIVTENLYVSIVCHNKEALKQDTDLSIAYRSLY